jgi:hypothetical protein
MQEVIFEAEEITPFFAEKIFLDIEELRVAESVKQIAARYEDRGVDIGSYPVIANRSGHILCPL